MKKLILFIILCIFIMPVSAEVDKFSKEYLQNNKHIALINPLVEAYVEHEIKSAMKKETGGKYKVHFTGYTTESMKKGIFTFRSYIKTAPFFGAVIN